MSSLPTLASAFSPADAFAALQAGRADVTERMSRAHLLQVPHDEAALTLLGLSLQVLGRPAEAAAFHRELTRLKPDSKEHWNNLGNASRESGRFDEAESAYLRALKADPDDANTLHNIGFLYINCALYVKARGYLLDALARDPGSVEARIYCARACYECGDNTTAEELIEPWRTWNELDLNAQTELGSILTQFGRVAEGEAILKQVLERSHDKARVRAQLVTLYERVNRLAEAHAMLDLLPPADGEMNAATRADIVSAQATLAMRGPDPAKARALLEQLLAIEQPEQHRANLYFSLARVADNQRDVHAVMRFLARAHAIQLDTAAQIVPELLAPEAQPLATASVHVTGSQFSQWESDTAPGTDASPVFVVGFPRSGTTMLEQMLDAHPALQSMDERAYLHWTTERVNDFGLQYPEDLGKLSAAQCEQLRGVYWEKVAHTVQLGPGQRLVDKNPLNMLRLPMIVRLFPNARIILALRHPCDVILSCYMQSFRSPAFIVLCSSLDRLSRGYVSAMRFWIHHAAMFQSAVMNLRYEDLLNDFAGNVTRIGEFLGLADAAPMLSFHEHAKNKGYIATPSYLAVVEKPNTRAVNRWRRYEEYFKPLLPSLRPILEHWGYDA